MAEARSLAESSEGDTTSTRPCRYPAQVWWGEQLVAGSSAATWVEVAGSASLLAFPASDVRWQAFEGGDGPAYSLPGSAPHPRAGGWRVADAGGGLVDGQDIAFRYGDLVAFDHDRARVELIDAGDGIDPVSANSVLHPAWGDATDLIALLDVAPDGDGWVGMPQADGARPVTEASQLLGQALVAACRLAPDRRLASASLIFTRPADARVPIRFDLTTLSSGRSFTALQVAVTQGGRGCAAGAFLLGVVTPDVVSHQEPAPPCAGPADAIPYDMGVTGRELRVVDAAYTDDSDAPIGPPVIDAWVRVRDAPADPALHLALLAQFTGHMSLAAALRPHAGVGQMEAHRTISMGINAIALSVHAEIRADQWIRYHHRSTVVNGGMTHAECRAYDESGKLLASFTVEAMLRAFADPGRTQDARTAI